MGAVTARDVLALLQRFGARLLAGDAGLDRPVTWACTARASPPAYIELRGGELALLALGTLAALHAQDDALTLARLIQDLNGRGVAVIAVAGLFARAMPEESATRAASAASGETRDASADELHLANTLQLPFVGLPASAPLPEIEREIVAAVARLSAAGSAAEASSTPRAIYDLLVHDSLRGDDDRALGEHLAGVTGAAVVLGDARDIRWCALPPGFPLAREALLNLLRRPSARAHLRATLVAAGTPAPDARVAHGGPSQRAPVSRGTVAPGPSIADLPLGAGYHWLAAPLHVGESAPLLLLLALPATETAHEGASTSSRASLDATLALVAPLFALSIARQRDLDSSRANLRAETLDALLAGTYPDEERMRARAAQLGYDLARPHIVLMVDLPPHPPSPRGKGEPESASPTYVVEALGERLAAELEGAWARASAGELLALVPVAPDATPEDLAALAGRLASLITRESGIWAAGMSEPAAGPAGLRHAAGVARDTARLGHHVLGPGYVARAADLGIYRLLLRLRETNELEDFCRQTLGPLLAEGRHAGPLLATLDAFFACNGNLSEAARRLDLHRNSLIYRLNRIRALLGHDLEDAEQRLALQLALKARRVLALGEPE